MKPFVIVFCSIWLVYSIGAQDTLSTRDVLATAFFDSKTDLLREHAGYQKRRNNGIQAVDKVELRTQTDRFDKYRQDYLARMSFNGIIERRRYDKLLRIQVLESEARVAEATQDALFDRYMMLHRWKSLQKEIALRRQLLPVLEDKISLWEQQAAASGELRADNLIKIEADRDDLRLRLWEDEAELQQIVARIAEVGAFHAPFTIDTTFWIGTNEMIKSVQLMPDSAVQSPEVRVQEAKIAIKQAEYQYEKSRQWQLFDFFQMRYTNRFEETLKNKIDFGIGITLPYSGSQKARQSAILIEKNAEETELQILHEQLYQKMKEHARMMNHLFTLSTQVQQQMVQFRQRYQPEAAIFDDLKSAQALLDFNEIQLRRQLQIAAYTAEIGERYIEVLQLSGAMSQSPVRNFLKIGMEVVE